MTESFHHNTRWDALDEEQRGAGVSQVVEAHSRQAGFVQQAPETSPKVADLDGRTDGGGEHQTGFVPSSSCQESLLGLSRLVVLKGFNDYGRQGYGPAALSGLGLHEPQLASDPL
jgi:hypothetical protein